MKKSDIQYHSDRGPSVPAVNVKIHWYRQQGAPKELTMLQQQIGADPAFTLEWIDQHVPDDVGNYWWNDAIARAWEQLEEDVNAENVFGRKVKIYSQGRSGGWAVVDGITADDVQHWNAIDVARWAKFAKFARQEADDVLFHYLEGVYENVYVPWAKEQAARQALSL